MSAALRDRPSVTNRIVQSSSPGPRGSRPIGRMLGRPAAVEVASQQYGTLAIVLAAPVRSRPTSTGSRLPSASATGNPPSAPPVPLLLHLNKKSRATHVRSARSAAHVGAQQRNRHPPGPVGARQE